MKGVRVNNMKIQKRFSIQDIDAILTAKSNHASMKETAQRLNRSYASVAQVVSKYKKFQEGKYKSINHTLLTLFTKLYTKPTQEVRVETALPTPPHNTTGKSNPVRNSV